MDSDDIQNKDKYKLNKNESKHDYKNIKSVYILKHILKNLQMNKLLEIIKFNKYMQKELQVSIKDYEDYSKIYSPIKIEIILEKINMVNLLILIKKTKNMFIYILITIKKRLKRKKQMKMIGQKISKLKQIIKLNHLKNYLIGVRILIQ